MCCSFGDRPQVLDDVEVGELSGPSQNLQLVPQSILFFEAC